MKGSQARLTRDFHKLFHCGSNCSDTDNFFGIENKKTHICDTCKTEIPIGQAYVDCAESVNYHNFQEIENEDTQYYHVKCIHKKAVDWVNRVTEWLDEGDEIDTDWGY